MNKNINVWDDDYSRGKLGMDTEPDAVLVKYASLVPKGRILDIGVGTGRNAMYFARMDYEVQGIDLSTTAIEKWKKVAEGEKLRVTAEVRDIHNYDVKPETYSLIIAAMVLHEFKKSETLAIISRLKRGIRKNGLFYISVYSTENPGYEKRNANSAQVEENTFYIEDRDHYIYYFQKDELLAHFPGWKLIYLSQTQSLEFGDDDWESRYYGIITYLGQKVMSQENN